MLKKISFLLLSAILVVILSACGEKENSSSTGSENAEAEGNENNKQIALAQKSLNYYAFVGMSEGVKKKAEELGYEVNEAVAEFDSNKQTNQFKNFITQKPAAIIANPNDADGLVTAINQANGAGIPVTVFDNPTSGGKVDFTISFDNYKAGQMAAEEIVKRLKEKYGKPKGVVLNAYGAMSSSAWRARREGFNEVMAKYKDITYEEVPAEGDLTKTLNAGLNAISKHGFVDAVHAPSDNPAMGLYEALKQTGNLKKVGEDGHVIFVTIDAEPIALQRIEEGYYDATINQDCIAYGAISVEMLDKYILKGEEVPLGKYENEDYYWKTAEVVKGAAGPQMILDPYVIDNSNVGEENHWANVAWDEYGLRY